MTSVSCFWREGQDVGVDSSSKLKSQAPLEIAKPKIAKTPKEVPAVFKDKNLKLIAGYFEKADSIHREAWWVLANERRSVGKSPFGKIHRALLAAQNIKLSNKSIFGCDRYLVKRDVLKLSGFPQKAEIFEKCSDKIEAKKIAQFFAPNANEIQAVFYPENLEELLGLGATVLNKAIQCTLKGNDKEQLVSLRCQNWSQERSKEHLILLDVYDYEMEGRNLIKLRGKVYENLSESRKIEADVPMQGKIFVTETELYPPEQPIVVPPPVKNPLPQAVQNPVVNGNSAAATITPITPLPGSTVVSPPIPAPRNQMDPDVFVQQQVQQQQQQIQTAPVQQLPEPASGQDPQLLQGQQDQPQESPQVPLQQWNPNQDIPQMAAPETEPPQLPIQDSGVQPQQEVEGPPSNIQQPENSNQQRPIPAGGVYGR